MSWNNIYIVWVTSNELRTSSSRAMWQKNETYTWQKESNEHAIRSFATTNMTYITTVEVFDLGNMVL